jgi:hypothetical protein
MAAGASVPGERHMGLMAEDGRAIRANDKIVDDIGGQAQFGGGHAGGVAGAPGGTRGDRGKSGQESHQAERYRPDPPETVRRCVQSTSLPRETRYYRRQSPFHPPE